MAVVVVGEEPWMRAMLYEEECRRGRTDIGLGHYFAKQWRDLEAAAAPFPAEAATAAPEVSLPAASAAPPLPAATDISTAAATYS